MEIAVGAANGLNRLLRRRAGQHQSQDNAVKGLVPVSDTYGALSVGAYDSWQIVFNVSPVLRSPIGRP